nr:hypothetical protein [Candidatus Tokpelaia sp.]
MGVGEFNDFFSKLSQAAACSQKNSYGRVFVAVRRKFLNHFPERWKYNTVDRRIEIEYIRFEFFPKAFSAFLAASTQISS